MKTKKAIALLAVLAILFVGCATNETEPEGTPTGTPTATPTVDAVTTASIVNNETAFLKAITKDGTWIIATLNDLTIDQELVLEGKFTYKDVVQRKIALYAQDASHNVTERYNLKAPKLTIKSENAKIQGGTFIGDVYVEANGFSVVDAKVEGNIYFAEEGFKSTFKLDNGGTVSGVTEVK